VRILEFLYQCTVVWTRERRSQLDSFAHTIRHTYRSQPEEALDPKTELEMNRTLGAEEVLAAMTEVLTEAYQLYIVPFDNRVSPSPMNAS